MLKEIINFLGNICLFGALMSLVGLLFSMGMTDISGDYKRSRWWSNMRQKCVGFLLISLALVALFLAIIFMIG